MAMSMDLEMLRKSIVLGALPPAELERLAPSLKRRSFRRGETLYHQGDPGHVLHVVIEGRVKVVLPSEGYLERLKVHYRMVKEEIERHPELAEKSFLESEVLPPESDRSASRDRRKRLRKLRRQARRRSRPRR